MANENHHDHDEEEDDDDNDDDDDEDVNILHRVQLMRRKGIEKQQPSLIPIHIYVWNRLL